MHNMTLLLHRGQCTLNVTLQGEAKRMSRPFQGQIKENIIPQHIFKIDFECDLKTLHKAKLNASDGHFNVKIKYFLYQCLSEGYPPYNF